MKNNQPQVNIPVTGMDRDSHPSRMKENSYSFAKNISLEDSSGNGLPVVQNEPSNLLCQNFKDTFFSKVPGDLGDFKDYKIVGFRYNSTLGRTYLMFANENQSSSYYGTSVIGYINSHVAEFRSEDYDEECGCISISVLDQPLENQEQENLCNFKVIAEDSCTRGFDERGNIIKKGCLGFSTDNPIFEKNIRFKNEQCGRRMYWTDRDQVPRYLDLDLVENPNWKENIYHHTGVISCGDEGNIVETCFDCEKLKMIPDYSIPCLMPTNIELGGQLKLGTYEFLIAYCDEEGNELSNYFSHTNPINLFDYNNVQMDQTELDRVTNYAIELVASNLDENFYFYKVAVIQHTGLGGEESYFIEGIHPITDKTILYTSDRNKQRTTLNNLLVKRVKVKSVEHMIDSNGYLFMAGIKNKPVLNLQPIVNFLGPYFKWASVIGKENFYQNGINASNFRSYMRDETYPLSISFGMTDGTETNDFILINRAPQTFTVNNVKKGDLDIVKDYAPTDLNYLSIQAGKNACGANERVYRWQYENTAQLKGISSLLPRCTTREEQENYITELGSDVFSKIDYKTCSITEMNNSAGMPLNEISNFPIRIDGNYRSNKLFLDYINDNLENYLNPGHQVYSSHLAFLLDKNRYKDFDCVTTNSCNCLDDEEPIYEEAQLINFDILDLSTGVPTYLPNIQYEELDYIETQFPEGIREEDYGLTGRFVKPNYGSAIHLRPKRMEGNSCEDAIPLKVYQDTVIEDEEGFVLPIKGSRRDNWGPDLLFEEYNSTSTDSFNYIISFQFESGQGLYRPDYESERVGREYWKLLRGEIFFPNKITKSALWVKTRDIANEAYLQINFSPISISDLGINENPITQEGMLNKTQDTAANRLNKIRVSIYEDCSTGGVKNPLKVLFLTKGELINLRTTLGRTQGEFLIAIDTPVIKLLHYNFDFVRKFEFSDEIKSLDGSEVPPRFRFMQVIWHFSPTLGYPTDFLVAHNVTEHGTPGWTGGPSGSGSSVAFREVRHYGWPGSIWTDPGNYHLVDYHSFITAGTDYSLMVIQRGLELDYMTYTVNNARAQKVQTYQRECFYEDLDEKICEGKPFEEGVFGYVESVEEYPDNPELFDSYELGITESMLDETIQKYKQESDWDDNVFLDTSETVKDIFIDNFGSRGSKGQVIEFINKDKSNFSCKPIRHFKFPNNNISPFLYTNENMEFQNTFVFPLGVSIDKTIVNIFLDIAVKTGQITQDQRDSIEYFKIKRGDRTLEKSIISKGLLTDVIRYRDRAANDYKYFANFPFNSLKPNELLSGVGSDIRHPYNGRYNNKFVFNSPEIEYNTIVNPTEISVEGYQFGTAEGQIDQVKDHAKMVLLSEAAITTAGSMAKTEASFEVLAQVAELGIGAAQASSGGGFLGFSGVAAGAVAGGFVAMVVTLRSARIKDRTAELRNKWIEIFKNNGIGYNFAHYITSVGHYNNYSNTINENSRLRRVVKSLTLRDGNYNINHPTVDGYMKINNIDREKSLFLYLGPSASNDGLRYLTSFYDLDNSNKDFETISNRELFTRNIANLYTALKVWRPDQYGQIGHIKWIDITGCNYLTEEGTSTFFGGDTFISKYAYKRKFNYFLSSGMLQADFTPFKYSLYFNVGRPKYYIDYETEHQAYGASLITTPSSVWNLSEQVVRGNYITGGRFYHYQYGIPYFFVESTINCWNRYAGTEPWESFYPYVGDYMAWTQETHVSIRKPNTFKYNYIYSNSGMPKNNNFLPNTFNSKFYNCINNSPNGIMYSSVDSSEKQKVDPWLIYKNFDFYNFPTSNGKLINLINIESTQILGVFENQFSVFNAIDVLKERVTPETKDLGSGGIFAQRPIDSHKTDNGYAGTQHKSSVSNEFGHFWVDARRGQVHQVEPNGRNSSEITQGLRNWFKEHLPFKILKGNIKGLTDLDLDNPFKNLGISLGWDSRFKRLFLTKLDYIVKPQYIGKLEFVSREGFEEADVNLDFLSTNKYFRIIETGEEVELYRKDIFEPVHFTVAYSPLFKTWVSYYDFTPAFYINYDNYFSTGFNSDKGPSIWSHLLTNKSFGVFYGKKYNWKIEVATQQQYGQKFVSNIEFWLDSIRYHNNYDYAINTKLGIDKAMVYNNSDSSGYLNLIVKEKNNRYQQTQYPKVTPTGTDILVTYDEGKWTFNDIFNRTGSVNSNVPLWNYDKNAIDKVANPKALSYNQRWLDRIRGDWFLLRLEGGSDTRFKQLFKWVNTLDNIVI